MKWVATDGTVLELGGKVTGDGPVAKSLRVTLAMHEDFGRTRVAVGALPHGNVILDVNNPLHMGPLLRQAAGPAGYWVQSEPELEGEPEDPRPELPDGAVY